MLLFFLTNRLFKLSGNNLFTLYKFEFKASWSIENTIHSLLNNVFQALDRNIFFLYV